MPTFVSDSKLRIRPVRRSLRYLTAVLALGIAACSQPASKYPTASHETLKLSRVFLYRNGIGYFERQGLVDGDTLRIKVRKDQVNDLLKTLTVVNRKGGQAVSISMPLDPQSWANAALATLSPGRGNLAQVLDTLRGTMVTLVGMDRTIQGRIVMVEELHEESALSGESDRASPASSTISDDSRITLMDGGKMNVMRLSRVLSVGLHDGDLALQFHRSLDASAGEGMFQQVEVSIRLTGAHTHDLAVSYVVPAPMWKPTYRVVLPADGKGKALLQGWAVVDNVSGEDWREIKLGLTSGAPIAFRYDLHTPRDVERPDLTETGVRKRAAVAVGETTYAQEEAPPPPAPGAAPSPAAPPPPPAAEATESAPKPAPSAAAAKAEMLRASKKTAGAANADKAPMRAMAPKAKKDAKGLASATGVMSGDFDDARSGGAGAERAEPPAPPTVSFESLRRSTLAQTRAAAASGLTRFDLEPLVTVPDGSSTMVAVVNDEVDGEETFLFKPGGAGVGYEANPYRVVRFKNSTPFALEPGPIAIYAGGSFVGEGISEAVGAGTSATIPFAVESGIMVTAATKQDGDEMRLLRIVRGVLEVESFSRRTTTWTAKLQTPRAPVSILIRHPKAGPDYELVNRSKGTEDLHDAYLVPVEIGKGRQEASISVVEQTPSRYSISIWEGRAVPLLEKLLTMGNLSAESRQKLTPIVARRQEIGKIESRIEELKSQQGEIDQRAAETRRNLEAIKKDAAANALRAKLNKRLEQFASDGDRLGREVVELQTKRMELRIELEDTLQNLDWSAPVSSPPKKTP